MKQNLLLLYHVSIRRSKDHDLRRCGLQVGDLLIRFEHLETGNFLGKFHDELSGDVGEHDHALPLTVWLRVDSLLMLSIFFFIVLVSEC